MFFHQPTIGVEEALKPRVIQESPSLIFNVIIHHLKMKEKPPVHSNEENSSNSTYLGSSVPSINLVVFIQMIQSVENRSVSHTTQDVSMYMYMYKHVYKKKMEKGKTKSGGTTTATITSKGKWKSIDSTQVGFHQTNDLLFLLEEISRRRLTLF